MSQRLQIAVFGGGHLGTIHARLLKQVPDAELVAIVEPSRQRCDELKAEFDCEMVTDVEGYAAQAEIDGAVIAAPTTIHHALGTVLLQRGVHCLIEKPLAPTRTQCKELVAAARRSNCILQVGHVERFNPAWTTFCDRAGEPRFIDAAREGTLTFRSMDAGVVLDLMIHDIDLVLSLVKSPVVSVDSSGFRWTGDSEDIALATLRFANGCTARLTASRVSSAPQRRMTVFGEDWFSTIDFGARTCEVVNGPRHADWQTRHYTPEDRKHLMENLYSEVLSKRDLQVPDGNPILDELSDFVTSIETKTSPIVTGRDGQLAVEIASHIIRGIEGNPPSGRTYRRAG